ncbi:MAG: hypothetical protein UT13_C0001G0638 [Candidatus Pacebacteria bacterium GW2011_GWF2_38_9]|nr:MAG: hypothetical protein US01_C0001G0666 [candidate division TM6 bacterium GW2011_GWF2_28_16]KKQ08678.1 MAG: hypothetical protein US20_C0013G0028 [Candidatus Pacebacteria bacterium GW2011_GWF1_36_5]KKQ88991.1 MAG: hypothetical protein UT13_C0001G0638 [Candidatus Pacebacteria bacterium GW2011_GWF2_38_9]HAZ73167.1 hypothetical protein [Candidatus Paceibacterota bacterium]
MNEDQNYNVAKLVGFASHNEVKYGDRERIYSDIVGNAVRAAFLGISYEVNKDDIKNHGWERREMKLGDIINVVSAEEYKQFLDSLGEEKERIIRYMEQRLNNYKQYQSEVRDFLQQIKQLEDIRGHQAHIAQNVFNVVISGKEYVMRYRPSPGDVGAYMMGALYIDGEEHFEQIVAASVEDGVTIAEKIPGQQLNKLNPDVVENISDEQINQCFDSLLIAWQRGLPMENKSKNIMYDEKSGFGFIDFINSFDYVGDAKQEKSQSDLIQNYFTPMFFNIVNRSASEEDWKPKTREAIENNILSYQRKLAMIDRLRPIALAKLDNKEEAKAQLLERIESDVLFYKKKIEEYSSEEFVSKTLAENNGIKSPQTDDEIEITGW